jgi:heme exporter protein D
MLALQIFTAITAFTLACFAVSSALQKRRTRQFQAYADQLAKEARARANLRVVD